MRGIGFFLTEGLAYDEREKRRLRKRSLQHQLKKTEARGAERKERKDLSPAGSVSLCLRLTGGKMEEHQKP